MIHPVQLSEFEMIIQIYWQLFNPQVENRSKKVMTNPLKKTDSLASDEPIANYFNRIQNRARTHTDGAFPTTIPRFSPLNYSSRRTSSKEKAKLQDDSSLREP